MVDDGWTRCTWQHELVEKSISTAMEKDYSLRYSRLKSMELLNTKVLPSLPAIEGEEKEESAEVFGSN